MILDEKSISVVVVVNNNLDVLEKALQLWTMVCTRYRHGAELVICDDGSEDGTEEFMSSYLEQVKAIGLRVAYIRKSKGNSLELCSNINQAQEYLNGKYVLFATGNSYPRGYLLDEYEKYLDDDTILSGIQQEISEVFNHVTIREERRSYESRYQLLDKDLEPWRAVVLNNSIWPVRVLEDIGWFNKEFDGKEKAEQEAAMLALYKTGAKFRSVPGAKMFHVGSLGKRRPETYVDSWLESLQKRYSSGKYSRSTRYLKPRPPKDVPE